MIKQNVSDAVRLRWIQPKIRTKAVLDFLRSSMGSFQESHGGPGKSDKARQNQLSDRLCS